jgi:hypothetical protein
MEISIDILGYHGYNIWNIWDILGIMWSSAVNGSKLEPPN